RQTDSLRRWRPPRRGRLLRRAARRDSPERGGARETRRPAIERASAPNECRGPTTKAVHPGVGAGGSRELGRVTGGGALPFIVLAPGLLTPWCPTSVGHLRLGAGRLRCRTEVRHRGREN